MNNLHSIGFDFPIRTTVSNNAYRDLNLGSDFERLAWKGIVAADYLEMLVWRTRPYEKQAGLTDRLFSEYITSVADRIRKKETFDDVLKQATLALKSLINPDQLRTKQTVRSEA